MKTFLIKFFILPGIGFLIYSCNNNSDCRLTENRTVKMAFAKYVNNNLIDSTVNEIYIKNLNDTVFYKWEPGSKVSLPLSQKNDSSLFIISTDSINFDTIIFHYQTKLTMVSSDCGFNTSFYSLRLDSNYTRHKIDTIITLQTIVSADVDKNYRIVLKPDLSKKSTSTFTRSGSKLKTKLHNSLIISLKSSDNKFKYQYQDFEKLNLTVNKKRKTSGINKFCS